MVIKSMQQRWGVTNFNWVSFKQEDLCVCLQVVGYQYVVYVHTVGGVH